MYIDKRKYFELVRSEILKFDVTFCMIPIIYYFFIFFAIILFIFGNLRTKYIMKKYLLYNFRGKRKSSVSQYTCGNLLQRSVI